MNTKGMTLIEALVAMAIFGIASLMLVTGYLTAARLTAKGAQIQKGGEQAVGQLESGGSVSQEKRAIQVEVDGSKLIINGAYENSQGEAYPEGQFWIYSSGD